ncbi:hypothetical protein LEAN103870_11500 [Legionella anisa]|uniref:Uncharacterized protein n=1 Tax=Legionella anisa TaxID=28082 RepID=A0AAX0WW41_9GAMM|nr:hypothetical protein [Legionella anisa]AWN73449.1 hypothetical protein DLD14_06110 [Legionella anisa]KTC66927.1 hypothetical protein Lani_3272 [Legionella anisa]MCW8426320.1 hypothetical protein [Legionella anisa]MCW8447980.1 hypothetical protein [Legionella anisa]PNL62639.1 hypothetical protein A6J39_016285 [Legionella anisa]
MSLKLNDVIEQTLATVRKNLKPGTSTSIEFDLLISESSKDDLLITPTLGQHQDGSRLKFKLSTSVNQ